ncbi:Septin-domain-containing protein [Tribonema minus]|uniref:Septin-domain-containing protein n=1 Tax=Tribonema minus TaxID=303371 RepID=A0A835YRL0_9STRA|nr:Septin-domain-containing protein [Tribonema minus]
MRTPKYRLQRMAELAGLGGCGMFEKPAKVVNYRLLLAGESGLGKTTMMGNLFRSYTQSHQGDAQLDEHPKTRLEDFVDAGLRHRLQQEFSVTYPEPHCDKIQVNYFLQDTPGYGDDVNVMNSINVVANHVKEQHLLWNKHVKWARDRGVQVDISKDTRFDVCLYFISPHRYRGIDVAYVEALRKYVNVIPIIAKSDTMSVKELKSFRPTILDPAAASGPVNGRAKAAGAKNSTSGGTASPFFSFPAELWEKYESRYGLCRPDHGVFAVVSSPTEDTAAFKRLFSVEPAAWPTREYAWGSAQAFNPMHSDTLALRIMLFELGFMHVDQSTQAVYDRIIAQLDGAAGRRGGAAEVQWDCDFNSGGCDVLLDDRALGVW